jgi:hypothetical protein
MTPANSRTIGDAAELLRMEYLEMPGLALTAFAGLPCVVLSLR